MHYKLINCFINLQIVCMERVTIKKNKSIENMKKILIQNDIFIFRTRFNLSLTHMQCIRIACKFQIVCRRMFSVRILYTDIFKKKNQSSNRMHVDMEPLTQSIFCLFYN